MSVIMQDWQSVESKRDLATPRKPAGPMEYLAVLVILAAIATLMTIFCSIGSASEHSPDRLHADSTTSSPEG
jgi:hypothetical protein